MSILTRFYCLLGFITLLGACRNIDTPAPELSTKFRFYAPYSVGSSFSYNSVLGDYTNIVESDTVMNGKVYKKLLNSRDSYAGYYIFDAGEYKVSGIAPHFVTGIPVELDNFTYLKDDLPEGGEWTIFVPVNSSKLKYTARFDFKILEKDATRTVNAKQYRDVVQVQQKIFTIYNDIIKESGTYNFWYAKGVGLIESDALSTKISNYRLK